MNILPNELVLIIFENILKITDKRQFLKTCKRYNTITTQSFHNFENNYKIKNFDKINDYCVEKFTLELCHDKYFDMIPNYYVKQYNCILIKALASFNCVSLLKLAKNRGCYINGVMNYAVKNGHKEVFFWAQNNDLMGFLNYNEYIDEAIKDGNLEGLKCAKAYGYNWNDYKYVKSIENGDLHILKWAKRTGSKLKISICEKAAFYGQLEILIWAKNIGCYCDLKICIAAAKSGHIKILNWARIHGFKLGKKTYEAAFNNNQFECLIWLSEHDCNFEK